MVQTVQKTVDFSLVQFLDMLLSCLLWAFMVHSVLKPVEIAQVQFLDKVVDVPVVCTSGAGSDSAENSRGSAVAVHRPFGRPVPGRGVDAPVVVQRQGDGPDSVSCLEALVVPQLQFNDILVDFPVVVMRQIPMFLVRFLSRCTCGGRCPFCADAAGSTGAFQRRCAHAATSSSCPVGQFRFSDSVTDKARMI